MKTPKKIVQGTYISIEAHQAFTREAEKRGEFLTRTVSNLLEKEALKIIKKEKKDAENLNKKD